MQRHTLRPSTRRQFASQVAGASLALASAGEIFAQPGRQIPVGLELYSVREELKKDWTATLQAEAQVGYRCVEFFAPYYSWTSEHAKEVRKKLDDLNMRCYSTHNGPQSFAPEGIGKAIELNTILGTKFVVMASPGGAEPKTIDEWKKVADTLNRANKTMSSHGIHAGYHNHEVEWKPVDGQRPMDVLASNTDHSVMLQLDVGTCVAAGDDPVAWIGKNPGRIESLHLKDWSPQQGYKVLFGEGVCPWKKIFAAAESKGGVEFYLIEQEGSRYSELDTARRCLSAYRELRSGKTSA